MKKHMSVLGIEKIKLKEMEKDKNMKFINIQSSESINQYINEQCTALINRIEEHPHKYKLQLTVRPEARNPEGKVKSFLVTGVIHVARSADLRVAKKSSDFKKAVEQVIKSLEKQMRRSTEKKERSRSTMGKSLKPVREYKWELNIN